MLEIVVGNAHHHITEHLDEAPVGVPGEAHVTGVPGDALHRPPVEPEVEHRIHHAGHGHRGPGAHRHQKGILGVPEGFAHLLLQALQIRGHLGLHRFTVRTIVLVVLIAGLGGNRESRGNGDAQVGHFGQVGPLAAEQLLHLRAAFGGSAAKIIYVLITHMDVSPFLNTVSKPEIFKPAGPEPEGFLRHIIEALKPIVNDYADYYVDDYTGGLFSLTGRQPPSRLVGSPLLNSEGTFSRAS